MNIREALASLDPEQDELWTEDGLPIVEVVAGLAGEPNLTREQITETDPEFCRDKALVKTRPPEQGPVVRQMPVRDQIRILDEEIASLLVEQDQINSRLATVQRQRDRLQEQLQATSTEKQDVQDRIDYITSQRRLREERVARNSLVLKGLNSGKAPIDEAMARKNMRGRQRPNVPRRGNSEAQAPKE